MRTPRVFPECGTLILFLVPIVAFADTFAPGSFIIPMDTTYQDSGMFRAYGLVDKLLVAGVPVRWVIKAGKSYGGTDFTASATDHQTNAQIVSHAYRGGPFVVDSVDAAAALPIINAWQTANTTTVHRSTTSFTSDVARTLVAAPRIAVLDDGNQGILFNYMNAAGIPDSQGNTWSATSPDLLTPVQVSGPSTSNHHDGALFDAQGDPVYCQFAAAHWIVASAQAIPEVTAETRQFLASPVHFFAECMAVPAFENLVPYGFFLTPNGLITRPQPPSVDVYHPDRTFMQLDGPFATVGGSQPAFGLPVGDSYEAAGVTMLTAHGSVEGANDLWMTGYLDGACPPDAASCGTSGKVSYLGGHQYSVTVPISTHPTSQGVRLFLNSLFDSACSSSDGQPQITLAKTAPAVTYSPSVTFTLAYANIGPTVALNAILTDVLPPGSSFVSATGGGTLSSDTVTWNLGNLGVGESGSVQVIVSLGALGTYGNAATLTFKSGLTSRSLSSNMTSTTYASIGSVPHLLVTRSLAVPGQIVVSWSSGCGTAVTDYEVYEGPIGAWYSHAPVTCSTGGMLSASFVPSAGNAYYLAVPRAASTEGSYGTSSSGAPIPQSAAPCLASQAVAACP